MEAQFLGSSEFRRIPRTHYLRKTNLGSTKDKLSSQSLEEYSLADPV